MKDRQFLTDTTANNLSRVAPHHQLMLDLSMSFINLPIGVETIAHGEYLLDPGCEGAQGYGIARPMPADQVIPWLEGWVAPASWLNRQKR